MVRPKCWDQAVRTRLLGAKNLPQWSALCGPVREKSKTNSLGSIESFVKIVKDVYKCNHLVVSHSCCFQRFVFQIFWRLAAQNLQSCFPPTICREHTMYNNVVGAHEMVQQENVSRLFHSEVARPKAFCQLQ